MKKKKKVKLTKQQKRIFIILSGVVFIMILVLSLVISPKKKQIQEEERLREEKQDINRDLTTIQDVVEYLESIYFYEEESGHAEYDIDVILSFKCDLYEQDGSSNELYFRNFYEKIAMVTKFKSFRLIDEEKEIIIAVKCNSGKISEVLINGQEDFYKKQSSQKKVDELSNIETLDLEVNSEVLRKLINANWKTENVNLGTQESTYDKYQIYFDEGYEVRNINGKLYNIVFTKKYKDPVIKGYKVGDNLEKIEAEFGTSYKDSMILGYKTKDFFVYFSEDEISVYPNYQYDYEEFENLIEEYESTKDINSLMYKLTDIWPDYDYYDYDTNYFDIWYTLKGVRISYNKQNPKGIEIYENYKGKLKIEQEKHQNLYYRLDKNLMIERETMRKMQSAFIDNESRKDEPTSYSEKFYFQSTTDGTNYKNVQIISIDGEYPNNEFDESILIYKYIWLDDTHFVYSILGKGMYIYNAQTRKTETLVTGNDEYNITNYDRNTHTIEYDGKQAQIEY